MIYFKGSVEHLYMTPQAKNPQSWLAELAPHKLLGFILIVQLYSLGYIALFVHCFALILNLNLSFPHIAAHTA